MIRFFTLLFLRMRLGKPWRYKAPFLISIPYFMMGAGEMAWQDALIAMAWCCCTILGISGFGYWLNDYTDQEEDQKAGKENALIDMGPISMFLLLFLFLTMAALPWVLYFPIDIVSGSLLGAEFLLFMLYSIPPFRWKEKGMLGVLADAGYAHAIPAVLACWTFFKLASADYPEIQTLLLVLFCFQFVLGIRNIFLHQLSDLEKDLAVGTKTLAAKHGKEKLEHYLGRLIVPFEWFFLLLLVIQYSLTWWWYFLVPVVFVIQIQLKRRLMWKSETIKKLQVFLSVFFDKLYVEWLPLGILLGLCLMDWRYVGLAGLHLLLFPNGLRTLSRELLTQYGILKTR